MRTACNEPLAEVGGELVEPVMAAGDLKLADHVRLALQKQVRSLDSGPTVSNHDDVEGSRRGSQNRE